MSTDALFQLGIVSVALNTSQKEEPLRRSLGRPLRVPARLAWAPQAFRGPTTPLHRGTLASRHAARVRRHPMQDQVSHSRTPA